MSDSQSLVPEATRALIGELLSEPVSATITAKDAQRFAYAAGDLNPIYFDVEAAKAAGYESLVVPPTFLAWALAPLRPVEEVRGDGLYRSGGRSVKLRVQRVMFGGEEWDFLAPVRAGDTITSTTRLKDLEEKTGSSCPFVLQTTETTFTNQHAAVVRGKSIAR